MSNIRHYMVDFTMDEPLSEEFFDLVSYQRAAVNRYFQEGKLAHYALCIEKSKLWLIIAAESQVEVVEIIENLPLSRFMEYDIHLLSQLDSYTVRPVFSLN